MKCELGLKGNEMTDDEAESELKRLMNCGEIEFVLNGVLYPLDLPNDVMMALQQECNRRAFVDGTDPIHVPCEMPDKAIQRRQLEQSQIDKSADDALESMIAIGTVEIVDNWVFYPSGLSLDIYRAINRMCDRLSKQPSVRFEGAKTESASVDTAATCVLCAKNDVERTSYRYSYDEVSEVCYACYVDTIDAVNKANATASKEDQQSPIEELRRAVAQAKADDVRVAELKASGKPIMRDMLQESAPCVVCGERAFPETIPPTCLDCHEVCWSRYQDLISDANALFHKGNNALRAATYEAAVEIVKRDFARPVPAAGFPSVFADQVAEVTRMTAELNAAKPESFDWSDHPVVKKSVEDNAARKTLEALALVDEHRANASRVFWENLYQSPIISTVCVLIATMVILYYLIRSDM